VIPKCVKIKGIIPGMSLNVPKKNILSPEVVHAPVLSSKRYTKLKPIETLYTDNNPMRLHPTKTPTI